MKYIFIISRIIVGLVFIFSGFVKAVDPLGSAYKFHDYFSAFSLGFLDWLSLPLAIALCTAEFTAGVAVLTGIRFREGIWVVILMMALFTPLTLVLALTNPVSDCGCFGDAVHLTNWQTFGKNVIIGAFTLFLFVKRKTYKEFTGKSRGWTVITATAVLLVIFSFYNLRYLPVIDFLPYSKGTVIAEKMTIPENMPVDEYNTTFIYEKDGVRKEFTLENYPANDSTWIFVDQKSVLVKKGYVPPIHDFAIFDSTGYDIAGNILEKKGYTLLMISKKLEEASKQRINDGLETGMALVESGSGFHVVTASDKQEFLRYKDYPVFCTADETTLKTIVRANPGYVLIKDGTIIAKWSWANLPGKDELSGMINE